VACPQFIRLITGFYFQPLSDNAYWLPSFGGNGTAVAGSVAVSNEYPNPSSTAPQPRNVHRGRRGRVGQPAVPICPGNLSIRLGQLVEVSQDQENGLEG
jgi:hypothetical protein